MVQVQISPCSKLGHYGMNYDANEDPHYIKPYFISPFTGEKLFIMICPSHMISNYMYIFDYRNTSINFS